MPEAPTHPDQEPKEPLLVVKYNVPFAIPIPNLDDIKKAISEDIMIGLRTEINSSFKTIRIRVEGHPGYTDPLSLGVFPRRKSTTLNGHINIDNLFHLVYEPFQRITNRNAEQKYFFPFGPGRTELEVGSVQGDKGPLLLNAKNVPISMDIFLANIWEASEGKDPTRVFIIHKNKVIEGLPYPYNKQDYRKGGYFRIDNTSWVEGFTDQKRPVVTSYPERMDSILILPSDPEFFRTAQILIGDKHPKLRS